MEIVEIYEGMEGMMEETRYIEWEKEKEGDRTNGQEKGMFK